MKFEFSRSKKFTHIHSLRRLDYFVKMNPDFTVRKNEAVTVVTLPDGFNPESLQKLRESQKELWQKYEELKNVYDPLQKQFNELNNEAKQLNNVLQELERTYNMLLQQRKAAQIAYRTCTAAENEAKIPGLIDLDTQVQDAKKAMNDAGIKMNATIDECNRIGTLSNTAGHAVNAVRAQLI